METKPELVVKQEVINTCGTCGKSFTIAKKYRDHKRIHMNTQCNICGKELSLNNSARHKKQCIYSTKIKEEKKIIFSCDLCTGIFMGEANLKYHKKRRHSTVTCERCNKVLIKDSLRKHLKHCLQDKHLKCENCDYKTARSDTFKLHSKRCKGLKTIPKCSYCGLPFKFKSWVRNHEEYCKNSSIVYYF